MTSETMTLDAATVYDHADRRRRIWAIFAKFVRQSRRVVRFLCLRVHGTLFRAGVLSQGQSDHATFADCGGVRDRLSDAAGRRLCFRLRRRQIWPKKLDDDLGADDVRRIARHRRTANL